MPSVTSISVASDLDSSTVMTPSTLTRSIASAIIRPTSSSPLELTVATVSSSGDEEVGRMIAEAMDRVSVDGVITVEESKSLATEMEVTEGMAFDRGYSYIRDRTPCLQSPPFRWRAIWILQR